MTTFQGIWQAMVLADGTIQEQSDHIQLTLSEQLKQDFYQYLKNTNSYEKWRADIHQQLEDDLQRQVQQVLEETERQERLAKLRRQYSRANQRYPPQTTENNTRPIDPYNEIDRRNQRVLYPLNAKDTYGAQNYHSSFNYQRTKLSSNSFNLETYNSYCQRRRLLQRDDEHLLDESTLDFPTYYEQRTSTNHNNNTNSSFLYGNHLTRTNKTDIINILKQQLSIGNHSASYTNKYGVIIDDDGPFWPRDFHILHPTPRLLSRELTPKEFYLTVTKTFLSSK